MMPISESTNPTAAGSPPQVPVPQEPLSRAKSESKPTATAAARDLAQLSGPESDLMPISMNHTAARSPAPEEPLSRAKSPTLPTPTLPTPVIASATAQTAGAPDPQEPLSQSESQDVEMAGPGSDLSSVGDEKDLPPITTLEAAPVEFALKPRDKKKSSNIVGIVSCTFYRLLTSP
jgi:hypothetical protein